MTAGCASRGLCASKRRCRSSATLCSGVAGLHALTRPLTFCNSRVSYGTQEFCNASLAHVLATNIVHDGLSRRPDMVGPPSCMFFLFGTGMGVVSMRTWSWPLW